MLLFDVDRPASRFLPMFILEKDILLPRVTIDVSDCDNRQTTFLALCPAKQAGRYTLDHAAYIFLFDCTGQLRQKASNGHSTPATTRMRRNILGKS